MLNGLDTSDWLLLVGAILGPILAVLATRVVDILRDGYARKVEVFTALMTTRRANLTPQHVEAMNRIEIEFANDERVMSAMGEYMRLLEEPWPAGRKEAEELAVRRRRRAFANLVQAIAKRVGRRIDRSDIMEGGYYPGGWAQIETLQHENLRLVNELLTGNISLPIVGGRSSFRGTAPPPRPQTPGSPFPPPPSG